MLLCGVLCCAVLCCAGYQEIMTDPSYKGQFVVFTHPHIGNVGINEGETQGRQQQQQQQPVAAAVAAAAAASSHCLAARRLTFLSSA